MAFKEKEDTKAGQDSGTLRQRRELREKRDFKKAKCGRVMTSFRIWREQVRLFLTI